MLLFERIFRSCRALKASSAARTRKFKTNTCGGVAAIVAIASPVLIGAMGLGGEAGFWYLTQRKVQNAADVAAHAAAVRHNAGDTFVTVEQLAEYVVGQSDVDLTVSTVTVNQPPATGDFIEDGAAIEVIVTQTVPRMFSAIYSTDAVQISARAVATAVGDGQGCFLALSELEDGAITIGGNSVVTLLNCEAISNGPNVSFQMNGVVTALVSHCIRTVGTVDLGLLTVTLNCGAPIENASPVGDPLSGLAEPALTGTCEDGSINGNLLPVILTPTEAHSSGVNAMRFCNGLTLQGSVVLNPGLYIIEGGDFRINAGAVIAGTGVTFFMADGVEIQWNGNAGIVLKAPTSGSWNSILLFGSRAATDELHSLNGNVGTILDGTIYTPSSDLRFLGNASTSFTSCTQVIADTIEIGGPAVLALHCLFPTGETIVAAGESSVVE